MVFEHFDIWHIYPRVVLPLKDIESVEQLTGDDVEYPQTGRFSSWKPRGKINERTSNSMFIITAVLYMKISSFLKTQIFVLSAYQISSSFRIGRWHNWLPGYGWHRFGTEWKRIVFWGCSNPTPLNRKLRLARIGQQIDDRPKIVRQSSIGDRFNKMVCYTIGRLEKSHRW